MKNSTKFEDCQKALTDLILWYKSHSSEKKRNEATTRLHLINTLLLECLGWEKEDCKAEERLGGTYSDYSLFGSMRRRILIVEAKKEGIYFEVPAGHKRLVSPISSIAKYNPEIKEAIEQVMGYCQQRGTPFGAVCNGYQLIGFIASRKDGVAPMEGNAVVFSSLEVMSKNFLKLWQFFSKPGIHENNLEKELLGISLTKLPAKLSASIVSYPRTIDKTEFQMDLEIIGDLVIGDISTSPELEDKFLKFCFCSSGALSQYASVSKKLLEQRYQTLFNATHPKPSIKAIISKKRKLAIKDEVRSGRVIRRPILLLGDVGVGKSIFILHFRKIDAFDIMKNSITLCVDFGVTATLTSDLGSFIEDELENQLLKHYDIDIKEKKFVHAVYHGELNRFSKTIYADLRKTNPKAYIEKQIEFLEGKISNRRNHLKESLYHLTGSYGKQIVIILDNVDQREYKIQEKVFVIAQEIAHDWPVTVFLSLRPQTFHQSKAVGALSGYHTKAFTIGPPRTDLVIKKRLEFALKITRGEIKSQYLRDSSIKLSSFERYIKILLYSFENNEELMEFIDNICWGNIRLALEFVTTFIGSGHIDSKKMLDKEIEKVKRSPGEHYCIKLYKFLRAIIYGVNKYFDPKRSEIANLFDISTMDGKEHFLLPILIDFIDRNANRAGREGFVETSNIYEYMQEIGFIPSQVDFALKRAIKKKLIISERSYIPEIAEEMPQLLCITPVGVYHIKKLIKRFEYIDAIIVDTPIIDKATMVEIKDVDLLNQRLTRAIIFCDYLDKQWNAVDKETVNIDWSPISKEIRSEIKNIGKILHKLSY